MIRSFKYQMPLVFAALLMLPLAQAATMGEADYRAGRTRIGAECATEMAACSSPAGNTKDMCLEEAKAVEVKALADAGMSLKVGAAAQDSADARRDANYQAAAEKCETLSGDAKAGCISAAKAQFGKS